MKFTKSWAAAAAMVALTGAAQAALVDRGGGMIYDTTRNITWLADMNYAKTQWDQSAGSQGFANGLMTWFEAVAWADQLVYGGHDDWRLPTMKVGDTTCTGASSVGFGYNCTGGELSGLFVTDLGSKASESVLDQAGDTAEQIANLALFSNVMPFVYWSGTEGPSPGFTLVFTTVGQFGGFLSGRNNSASLFAVAVRSGDVPEPQTLALVLLALGATVVARRRRSR
jgi:hypothetical protein